MGFYKCIMTCIHHYNIIQNSFTSLKVLPALLIHPSPAPSLAELSTVSIVLSFPRCHIIGVIQYVAFSDCILFTW